MQSSENYRCMSKNGLVNETAAVQKVRTATCPTLCFLQVAPLPVGASSTPPFLLSNLKDDVWQDLPMSVDKSLFLPGRRSPLSVVSSRRLAASTLVASAQQLFLIALRIIKMKLLVAGIQICVLRLFIKSGNLPACSTWYIL